MYNSTVYNVHYKIYNIYNVTKSLWDHCYQETRSIICKLEHFYTFYIYFPYRTHSIILTNKSQWSNLIQYTIPLPQDNNILNIYIYICVCIYVSVTALCIEGPTCNTNRIH